MVFNKADEMVEQEKLNADDGGGTGKRLPYNLREQKDKKPSYRTVMRVRLADELYRKIVDIVEGQYVTRGDANEIEDGNPVTKDKIVGTYLFNIPKIGFVMGEITPKHYLVAGIWIIIVNVIAAALKNAASPEKQEEKE